MYHFALRSGLKNAAADAGDILSAEFPPFRKTLSALNTVEIVVADP